MLDLQVFGVVLIVVLFSLGSILLISKLPKGKTFDEMLEEKRQFREQLMAAANAEKTVNNKKEQMANQKKKGKPQPPKKNNKKLQQVKPKPESEESAGHDDSDTQSEKSGDNQKELFVFETEAFSIADMAAVAAKANKGGGKRNKNKGILVNKNEQTFVKENAVVVEVNNFEQIHPKDVIELQRQHSAKEEVVEQINHVTKNKGKKGKKYTPPISPVNQVKDSNKEAEELEIVEEVITPIQATVVNKAASPPREKRDKKKKVDVFTAPPAPAVNDEEIVRNLLRTLSTAELTRNEIQLLIDFLLNKQHDTTAKDPTEWSEGKSDMLQKLKKQLQEKEKLLQEEQEASSAFQSKLRELRNEFNVERSQFNASIKNHVEELNNKKKELQGLTERFNNEKRALTQQYQQQLLQYKNEAAPSQEAIQKLQQLTVQVEQMKQEMISRDNVIANLQRLDGEHRAFIDGLQKTLGDRDQRLVEFDRILVQKDEQFKIVDSELRQRLQDLGARDQELQVLRSEVARKSEELDHFYKSCEQLKVQLADVQAKASNANHIEDANKVEIKNLQNALDSSKKEVNSYKTQLQEATRELTDLKQRSDKSSNETVQQIEEMKVLVGSLKVNLVEKDGKLDEYENLIKKLKLEQDELRVELEEQKTKNNVSTLDKFLSVHETVRAVFLKRFAIMIHLLKLPGSLNPDIPVWKLHGSKLL